MELTGKCKEIFENWYLKDAPQDDNYYLDFRLRSFYSKEKSMKYGVYVDFFDSVGSHVSVSGLVLSKTYICDISVISNVEHYYDGFPTRLEARTAAIEKANEIYNSKQ
jgi:hypothetical protein